MDFAFGEPFLFSTFVKCLYKSKGTYLSVSSNQSGHISNDLCHLFLYISEWTLETVVVTIHKTDDFRHNTPHKIVTVTSLLPSGLLFYYVLYFNLPFVSHFFLSLQILADVYVPWLKRWFILSHWWALIKIFMTWKKNARTAVPLYNLSWFKCCYYLSSSPLHSEWRHKRQPVISFTATSNPASLPGIQMALGALVLIIKPSHCSELAS